MGDAACRSGAPQPIGPAWPRGAVRENQFDAGGARVGRSRWARLIWAFAILVPSRRGAARSKDLFESHRGGIAGGASAASFTGIGADGETPRRPCGGGTIVAERAHGKSACDRSVRATGASFRAGRKEFGASDRVRRIVGVPVVFRR